MKITLGVLFGGRSVEHEISILSALQVINAVDRDSYQVLPIYISKEGWWYTGDALLAVDNYKDIDQLKTNSTRVVPFGDNGRLSLLKNPPPRFGKNIIGSCDVAIPVTHGTFGEDGCLQGLLEMYGIPYVGCDVTASALGMDKIRFKEIGVVRQLPMVEYLWFFSRDWYGKQNELREKIAEQIGFPLIVKPYNLGSSIGVSVVNKQEELEDAVSLTSSFSERVIIEKFVGNLLEINCAVLGDNDEVQASVCEEPLHNADFLSYSEKYQSKAGSTKGMQSAKRKIPADISEEMTTTIQNLACRTFQVCGANGVARIDFLINRESNEIFVNEINTIPGSMAFYLWSASSLEFDELIDRLVRLALKRFREHSSLLHSNPVNILSLSSKNGGAKG
jgi:D-alanine-D-alanine ligase